MLIKFKEIPTDYYVRNGLAKMAMYLASQHEFTPKFTQSEDPLKDFWEAEKRLTEYFKNSKYKIEKEVYIDETNFPIIKDIIKTPLLKKADPVDRISVDYTPANIGRLTMWGQIIGNVGSIVETPRYDVKTRLESLAKRVDLNGEAPAALKYVLDRYKIKYTVKMHKEVSKEQDWGELSW